MQTSSILRKDIYKTPSILYVGEPGNMFPILYQKLGHPIHLPPSLMMIEHSSHNLYSIRGRGMLSYRIALLEPSHKISYWVSSTLVRSYTIIDCTNFSGWPTAQSSLALRPSIVLRWVDGIITASSYCIVTSHNAEHGLGSTC